MSFYRAKLRATDKNVYLDNRLTNFTKPPILYGDLIVENNELVGNNLDVSGNLTVGKDLRAKNFYASGNYYVDNYLLVPYGTIIQSAAVNVPEGWLVCDGSTLACSDYPDLFDALQYTYGGYDLSFNIPDLRGRAVIGIGHGVGLTDYNLGDAGGEETHLLTVGEIPAHTHELIRKTNDDSGAFDTNNGHKFESSAATTDRANLGNFSTFSKGGSNSHNNMQPYFVLYYLIKY